jgi:hypothetical protein
MQWWGGAGGFACRVETLLDPCLGVPAKRRHECLRGRLRVCATTLRSLLTSSSSGPEKSSAACCERLLASWFRYLLWVSLPYQGSQLSHGSIAKRVAHVYYWVAGYSTTLKLRSVTVSVVVAAIWPWKTKVSGYDRES